MSKALVFPMRDWRAPAAHFAVKLLQHLEEDVIIRMRVPHTDDYELMPLPLQDLGDPLDYFGRLWNSSCREGSLGPDFFTDLLAGKRAVSAGIYNPLVRDVVRYLNRSGIDISVPSVRSRGTRLISSER